MIPLLCILLGLVLGQHLKVTISPEFQAFITRTWTIAQAQIPTIKATSAAAVKQLKSTASKTLKASSKPALSSGEVV
jgi:hypothetical protein